MIIFVSVSINYISIKNGFMKRIFAFAGIAMVMLFYGAAVYARITITKDVAVVDYYFSLSITTKVNEESKTEDSRGKNVEFYLKENGKWLLIGDMTYFDEKDDD